MVCNNKSTFGGPVCHPLISAKQVFLIILAIFLFDVQGAIIKYLGDQYPVQQLAMYRNLFGLLPSFLVLYLSAEWHSNGRPLIINRWKLGLLRGFFIATAQFCLYYSLTIMAFATASTLAFAGPLFITTLSVPLLKHKVGLLRWLAVAIGFGGVLLIVKPGSEIFKFTSLLPICAAFFYALSSVCVRFFEKEVPTATINLYSSFGALLGSSILLLTTTDYIDVDPANWFWLIAMGVVGGFAVLSMISAYRLTQPSNLSPFEYFGIPFSYMIGWIIFNETPFDQLFPGVILIVAGGLLIVWRERKAKALN